MAAAYNSLWFDADNGPLERGMWLDTGLDGKRFQDVCLDCCLLVDNLKHGGVVKHHVRQIVHSHIIIIIIIIII